MGESIYGLKRSHKCTELGTENIGETVTVMGWVQKQRNLGSLVFVDLRDRSGILQIVFTDKDGEMFEKSKTIRSEFVLAVVGTVSARAPEAVNKKMATGGIEITAKELRILSTAETPPIYIVLLLGNTVA